jgi:endonuclease YncB( thermonuclease family)
MRRGWWQFWRTSAWREWSGDLAAWHSEKAARAVLTELITAKTGRLAEAEQFAHQTRRALGWVEAFSPRQLPVNLSEGEIGLGEVGGVTLLQERRRFGRGSWVKLASGPVYFTSHRMIFEGRGGPTFEYEQLTDAALAPDGFHLTVETRSYLLEGPAEQLDIGLVAAEALARGVDPMVTVLDAYREASRRLTQEKSELRWLNGQLRSLAKARPRSPVWMPLALIAMGLVAFLGVSNLFNASGANQTALVADGGPETLVQGSIYELATATAATSGQTITVRFPEGTTDQVRLIGIDAPEGDAPYAAEAQEFLSDLVTGKEVWLVSDTSDRDQSGRLLRYVYVDQGTRFVNLTMVENGFAVAEQDPPDTEFAAELSAAAQAAEAATVGLWSEE